MERIFVIARFPDIAPDRLAEFKDAAQRAHTLTKDEAETLRYDWFMNEDESVCVLLEEYENSSAVLAHVAGMGNLFSELLDAGGGCTLEVFGQPSEEFLAAAAGLEMSVFPSFLHGK